MVKGAPQACNGRHLTRIERWWLVLLVPIVGYGIAGVISAMQTVAAQGAQIQQLRDAAATVDSRLSRLQDTVNQALVLLGRLEERLPPR